VIRLDDTDVPIMLEAVQRVDFRQGVTCNTCGWNDGEESSLV
jgi:hypothetical protein